MRHLHEEVSLVYPANNNIRLCTRFYKWPTFICF